MHALSLLRHARLVGVAEECSDWYRYVVLDEADDLWVYSFTHQGLVRFNWINPAHLCFLIRSWAHRTVVLAW